MVCAMKRWLFNIAAGVSLLCFLVNAINATVHVPETRGGT